MDLRPVILLALVWFLLSSLSGCAAVATVAKVAAHLA
jgi:hypothetical protein